MMSIYHFFIEKIRFRREMSVIQRGMVSLSLGVRQNLPIQGQGYYNRQPSHSSNLYAIIVRQMC